MKRDRDRFHSILVRYGNDANSAETNDLDLTREKFASVGKSERKKSRTFPTDFPKTCVSSRTDCRGRIARCAADPYQIRAYINTRDIRGSSSSSLLLFHRISPSVCRDFLFGIVDT